MNKLISENGEMWTSHDFIYNKDVLTTLDDLQISVAELKMVLASIVRKNKLPPGAVDIQ